MRPMWTWTSSRPRRRVRRRMPSGRRVIAGAVIARRGLGCGSRAVSATKVRDEGPRCRTRFRCAQREPVAAESGGDAPRLATGSSACRHSRQPVRARREAPASDVHRWRRAPTTFAAVPTIGADRPRRIGVAIVSSPLHRVRRPTCRSAARPPRDDSASSATRGGPAKDFLPNGRRASERTPPSDPRARASRRAAGLSRRHHREVGRAASGRARGSSRSVQP